MAVIETVFTDSPDETPVGGELHANRDRGAAARGSGRRRHGGRNGEGINGEISILTPVYPRQHVGRAELTSPWPVRPRARRAANPSRIGALAATGATDVAVYERPRVAILSTGNEVVSPGQPLGPGQIYDINQYTLSAVIQAHGGTPVVKPTAPDDLRELTEAVLAATSEDLLIFSGGSSVGERDLIMDVLRDRAKCVSRIAQARPADSFWSRQRQTRSRIRDIQRRACRSDMLLVPMLHRCVACPLGRNGARTALTRIGSKRLISSTGVASSTARRFGDSSVGRHHQHVARLRLHEISPQNHIGEAGEIWSEVLLTSVSYPHDRRTTLRVADTKRASFAGKLLRIGPCARFIATPGDDCRRRFVNWQITQKIQDRGVEVVAVGARVRSGAPLRGRSRSSLQHPGG